MMKESNKHNQFKASSNEQGEEDQIPANKKFIVVNDEEDLHLIADNIEEIIRSKMIVALHPTNLLQETIFGLFQSINQFVMVEHNPEKMSHKILKFVSEGEMTEASKSDVIGGSEEEKNSEIRKMFEQH